MRNHITITDIRKRTAVLNESTESIDSRNISNAYELANKTDRFEDIRNFVKECGSSRYNASEYIKPCIEFLEKSDNKELNSIFENSVLPRVNDFELSYNLESSNNDISNLIKTRIIKNKVIDRLLKNDSLINLKVDIESLFENSVDNKFNILTICKAVDSFDLPPYAKVNISLEEGSYLLQKYGIDYNEKKDLVNPIVEYYSVALELSEDDKKKINKVVSENYLLETEYAELMHSTNCISVILNTIEKYKNRSEHNTVELATVTKNIFSATTIDWINNIGAYFKLLTYVVVLSGINEYKDFIIENILPTFYNDFERRMGGSPELKSLCKATITAIDNEIKAVDKFIRMSDYIRDPDDISNIGDRYKVALENLRDQFNNIYEISYYPENVHYMTDNIVTEAVDRVTLYEYKLSYKEGLLSKAYRFDRYIQKQIRNWAGEKKQKLDSVFKDLDERIHEEQTFVEDYITPEGNVELLTTSLVYNESTDINLLHEFVNKLIESYNKKLSDTSYVVYYVLESDRINFYMKDFTDIILSEEEYILVNEKILEEYQDRLANVMYISECIDPEFDLVSSAEKYFSYRENSENFETFCDMCSLAGVNKEVVEEIYNYTVMEHPAFRITNSYHLDNYVAEDLNPIVCSEGVMLLQALLEAPVNKQPVVNKKNVPNKPNGTRTKVTPTVKNSKNVEPVKNSKVSTTSKTADTKDKVEGKSNPFKGVNLNNLKLYAAGLKKHAKDIDSTAKTKVRDMDFMVERLIKSLKQALISDRREAIIKGSIIPSFHKCILIAVGLAGLAWFNAPLAIITAVGGFAASKNLTKKERALMLDDIEIELELLEKEIQLADSRNQVKKLRQLMKMRKQLQREYQRIKYNIRIGKDIIPSTSYLPDNITPGGR